MRLKKFKDAELGLDFTSTYVNSLNIIVDIVKEKEASLNINKRLLQIISEKISFGKNIKRKKEEELLSDSTENNLNPLFNEVDDNKNEIEKSSEFNLSPTDGDIEKEADEISLLNIDNRKNIIFLQL